MQPAFTLKRQRALSLCLLLAGALGCVLPLAGQTLPTTISVTANDSVLTAVRTNTGGIMTDPMSDQQTGQNAADFVSLAAGSSAFVNNAATATTLTQDAPGFFIAAGQLGGADSLMFRFQMHDQNGAKVYVGGYVGVGIDLGGQGGISVDGKPDLFMVVKSTSATPTFVFEVAGTGANTAPNNTTAAAYTTTANTTLTPGTTFDYSASSGHGATSYSDSATAVTNYDFTFAISWTNLSTAIANMGNVNGSNFANFGAVNANTQFAFFFFTSQQANAYNQDIGGGNITSTATASWTSLGAFSTVITGDGRMPNIPEPATVAQTGTLLLIGVGMGWWRRRKTRNDRLFSA